ncbi:hypothetical protein D3C71_1060740 [compost metagenome]
MRSGLRDILENALPWIVSLLSVFAFLVTITITPLAARAPQMDAAAASLSTVTDSTSLGLISEKLLLDIGKPSTTISGLLSA